MPRFTNMGKTFGKHSSSSRHDSVIGGSPNTHMKISAVRAETKQSRVSIVDSSKAMSLLDHADENIQHLMNKKISQNKTNFDLQVKNMKPIIMEMAVSFLKTQSLSLAKILTS